MLEPCTSSTSRGKGTAPLRALQCAHCEVWDPVAVCGMTQRLWEGTRSTALARGEDSSHFSPKPSPNSLGPRSQSSESRQAYFQFRPYCCLVLPNLSQALEVFPRTLAWAVEGLQDMSSWEQGGPIPRPGQNADCGARTRCPSWRRKEPGPPSAESLVTWDGRGIDLTSCLNLALVTFFNRGYDPPSSLSLSGLPYILL